eukprot:3786666-Rhodomonas_salina.2
MGWSDRPQARQPLAVTVHAVHPGRYCSIAGRANDPSSRAKFPPGDRITAQSSARAERFDRVFKIPVIHLELNHRPSPAKAGCKAHRQRRASDLYRSSAGMRGQRWGSE